MAKWSGRAHASQNRMWAGLVMATFSAAAGPDGHSSGLNWALHWTSLGLNKTLASPALLLPLNVPFWSPPLADVGSSDQWRPVDPISLQKQRPGFRTAAFLPHSY